MDYPVTLGHGRYYINLFFCVRIGSNMIRVHEMVCLNISLEMMAAIFDM